MPLLSELEQTTYARIVLFGPPKSGKSLLAGKLAGKYKLLWIDVEKGYSVLFQLPKEYQKNIQIVSIPDTRELPLAIESCLKLVSGNAIKLCVKHGKVNCPLCAKAGDPVETIELNTLGPEWVVVYDSLTQLANSAMAAITRNETDDYKYDWDDYRKQGTLMDKFLTNIQQAKYNVICITHEVEAEMEDGSKRLVPGAGTRNFSTNVAKYFDHVVYAHINGGKHKFGSATSYKAGVLTGSRTGIAIEGNEEATLLGFFTEPPKATQEQEQQLVQPVAQVAQVQPVGVQQNKAQEQQPTKQLTPIQQKLAQAAVQREALRVANAATYPQHQLKE